MWTHTQGMYLTVYRHEYEIDDQEQYSKRDNVLTKGIPEERGENTNDIVCSVAQAVGVPCEEKDISTSHRIGQWARAGSKPRPFMAKFVRHDTRTQMLRNKKELKKVQGVY